ncbi:tetratricopeptide repeat protein [Caenimonas terrae]|uniref:Tetratricopeptide repeat protein n=1 Tax=Caenimonas terrae TaxID=696074 RepID=A0ABW0N7Q0_9BURK
MLSGLRKLWSRAAPPAQAAAGPEDDWLQAGNGKLAAGDLEGAAACYRKAVEHDPRSAAAHVNLGFALLQLQAFGPAQHSLEQAAALDAGSADARYLLAGALQQQGHHEQALASYRAALACKSAFDVAWRDLASLLAGMGRPQEAQLAVDQGLAACPGAPELLHVAGMLALERGEHGRAGEIFAGLVAANPEDVDAHVRLAALHKAGGRPEAARRSLEAALALQPESPALLLEVADLSRSQDLQEQAVACYRRLLALDASSAAGAFGLARSLLRQQQHDEALQWFDRAAQLAPKAAPVHAARGNAMLARGRLVEALAAYDKVLELQPRQPDTLVNRGNALLRMGRFAEAEQSYRAVLQLDPRYLPALINLGSVLQEQNAFDQALAAYEQALALAPEDANIHWNKALCHLVTGNWEAGWRGHEWRRQAKALTLAQGAASYSQPQWDGAASLRGKTMLLHAEQGLGDTLQFCRYAQAVQDRGATVLLAVPPTLRRLLGRLAGVDRLLVDGEPLPRFDVHCPLPSLPLAFGTTPETVPAAIPYLSADPAAARAWRERLVGAGLKVGIVWSGNPAHVNDHNRSIALKAMLQLATPGVQLVSLQKELRDGEAQLLEAAGVPHVGAELQDLAATAGLVAAMDLVVSVDTSAAHLAGALGRPLWLLLPFSPDWRWLLQREDSPWYPGARLFRQDESRDWAKVLERVRRELAARATAPASA